MIELLNKLREKSDNFKRSVDILNSYGVQLHDDSNENPPDKFDISILNKLMKMYKEIENLEKTVRCICNVFLFPIKKYELFRLLNTSILWIKMTLPAMK